MNNGCQLSTLFMVRRKRRRGGARGYVGGATATQLRIGEPDDTVSSLAACFREGSFLGEEWLRLFTPLRRLLQCRRAWVLFAVCFRSRL